MVPDGGDLRRYQSTGNSRTSIVRCHCSDSTKSLLSAYNAHSGTKQKNLHNILKLRGVVRNIRQFALLRL